MAFKWKTWTAGWLLVICWMMLPAVLVAEEGANADAVDPAAVAHPDILKMFGEYDPSATMNFAPPPDWDTPLPAPVDIRHWAIYREEILKCCLDLPAGVWTTVLDEEFTTGAATSYIELDYNAKFEVKGGSENPFQGILFRVKLVQNEVESYFHGAGEDFAPFISRRDYNSHGQSMFGSFVGLQYGVAPSTNTQLVLELKSTDLDGTVCFQNIIVRND